MQYIGKNATLIIIWWNFSICLYAFNETWYRFKTAQMKFNSTHKVEAEIKCLFLNYI